MISLLICIAANVGIFLCFRLFGNFRINTFQAISVNYLVCVVVGILFSGWTPFIAAIEWSNSWLVPAAVLGLIFIGTFYLMARTTQQFSITVASIASKISLVIPVLVSFFILGTRAKEYSWINLTGILVAFLAILLSSWQKRETGKEKHGSWYLPLLVFVLGGIIDTSLNYLNLHHIDAAEERIFPIFIFLVAALTGFIFLLARRSRFTWRSVIGGIVLGSVNYFSLYFVLQGLSEFNNDGAFFFPLLNVGIILLAALLSALIFRERPSMVNLAGVALAILSIFLLSYQEMLGL